jgi:hypothetical protein
VYREDDPADDYVPVMAGLDLTRASGWSASGRDDPARRTDRQLRPEARHAPLRTHVLTSTKRRLNVSRSSR